MAATLALLCYNQESFVADAVAAALAQIGDPLEIIISDDCSSDSTWRVIQAAVENYAGPHRIRLSRNNENVGVGAHTDLLIRQASNDIVILAAGDDISLPHRCQTIVQAMHNPSVACVGSYVIENGKRQSPLPNGATDARRAVLQGHPLLGATLAFRRQTLTIFPAVPKTVRYGEDMLLPFRAALIGQVSILTDALVIYRTHDGSLMGSVGNNVSHKAYSEALRRTVISQALVRNLQIDAVRHALEAGFVAPADAPSLIEPIVILQRREEPLYALLTKQKHALWIWLLALVTSRLTIVEAIKTIFNGLAPKIWHAYAQRRRLRRSV